MVQKKGAGYQKILRKTCIFGNVVEKTFNFEKK